MTFPSSFSSFDPNRVDQIVETLAAMLQRRSIARELETLKQLAIMPEQVDEIILAAINASLNLEDEHLATEIPEIRIDFEPMHPKAARAA
jgi:DNA-directed RNA polymerase subunit F